METPKSSVPPRPSRDATFRQGPDLVTAVIIVQTATVPHKCTSVDLSLDGHGLISSGTLPLPSDSVPTVRIERSNLERGDIEIYAASCF